MCLLCKKAKKRTDVMIFAEGEYNSENEIIKSTFAKYGVMLSNSLCYICKVCYYLLRKEKE